MLLRFQVSNYRSIYQEQSFSFIASSLKDNESGLIEADQLGGLSILPAAVVYGANASGKSNFIASINFMIRAILKSHREGIPDGGVPRRPFALDKECEIIPSSCVMDFIVNNTRYQYGFTYNDDVFLTEWLYAYPKKYKRVLFERNGQTFEFGRFLAGQNKVISELTRDNSLFLSAAIQNGHEELSLIAKFFSSIRIDQTVSVGGAKVAVDLTEKDLDERVISFLSKIGTGITAFKRSRKEIPGEVLEIRNALNSALKKGLKKYEIDFEETGADEEEILLAHKGVDGTEHYFDINWESAGTRRLLLLLGRVFRSLDQGTLLLVDELDASLHTFACEAVLSLFCCKATNPHNAQLVATTHDTNLLRSPILRRDQIWFTEKDEIGSTDLFPLTDIHTRKGDNIELGYLQGRFGAVPISGSVDAVFYDTEQWIKACPQD